MEVYLLKRERFSFTEIVLLSVDLEEESWFKTYKTPRNNSITRDHFRHIAAETRYNPSL